MLVINVNYSQSFRHWAYSHLWNLFVEDLNFVLRFKLYYQFLHWKWNVQLVFVTTCSRYLCTSVHYMCVSYVLTLQSVYLCGFGENCVRPFWLVKSIYLLSIFKISSSNSTVYWLINLFSTFSKLSNNYEINNDQ